MTPTGLLFAIVSAVSGIGFMASLARPAWFRFNGGVPRRWKIGTTWLVLVAISTLGMLAQRNADVGQYPSSTPAQSTESSSDTTVEMFPGEAVSVPDVDVPMDAAKPAEETVDTVIDVAPPPPPALSLPPVPPRRHR